MKTLLLRYTVVMEVDVPDDFPVTTDEIEKTADWHSNDYTDGRHAFSAELMFDGAMRAARENLESAIEQHYFHRVRMWAKDGANAHYEACNKLIERCSNKLGSLRLANGGTIEIAATWHPIKERYTYDPHIIICREDMKDPIVYELATRTVFEGREAAEAYAATIASCRQPIVCSLPLSELRVGEDRGRLSYWR